MLDSIDPVNQEELIVNIACFINCALEKLDDRMDAFCKKLCSKFANFIINKSSPLRLVRVCSSILEKIFSTARHTDVNYEYAIRHAKY